MEPERIFLGWDRPLISRAVDWLVDRWTAEEGIDSRQCILVLPTSHARRLLIRRLRTVCAERSASSIRPDVITTGSLPERLYQTEAVLAGEFERTLAWTAALRSVEVDQLRSLIATPPSEDAPEAWFDLAAAIGRTHERLAAIELGIADVAGRAESDAEAKRWSLLTRLHESYRRRLIEVDRIDPHDARMEAVAAEKIRAEQMIILVGTADLSPMLTKMLTTSTTKILALVAAPDSAADRFDPVGGLRTEAWTSATLPLRDDHWVAAGDIQDQVEAMGECVADFSRRHSPDRITLGVSDPSQVDPIAMRLASADIPTRRNLGLTIRQTAPGRLLELVTDHLRRRTWESLAALVRHADWLPLVTDDSVPPTPLLTQLDGLMSDHLPVQIDRPLPDLAKQHFPVAADLPDRVDERLKPLRGQDRSLAKWAIAVSTLLDSVYRGQISSDDFLKTDPAEPTDAPEYEQSAIGDRTARAYVAVRAALGAIATIDPDLDLIVSADVAMQTVTSRLAEVRIVDPQTGPNQIAILGWLDLALDDADAIAVCGVNHPFVPAAVHQDPFLPAAIRNEIRQFENDRRFARDAYALKLITGVRDDARLIVGKRAADGSPTPPSRLLAAAEAVQTARRIRQIIDGVRPPITDDRPALPDRWSVADDAAGGFRPPELPSVEPIGVMSVTSFGDYLKCPYRYYLRHVLGLRPLDDAGRELAANQFGDLVHGALERFGQSGQKDASSTSTIRRALLDHLHAFAEERYGDAAGAAVRLQIAQAERRLTIVADRQARRVAEGWVLHAAEAQLNEDKAFIEVDGTPMGLRGRFDRIDHHPESGRWAILDYKTHAHTPEKKHLEKRDGKLVWVDLQLPLYRRMIPALLPGVDPSHVQLGYFNVADTADDTGINIANFSPALMTEADRVIEGIVRRIRRGDFRAADQPPRYDDYAMLFP